MSYNVAEHSKLASVCVRVLCEVSTASRATTTSPSLSTSNIHTHTPTEYTDARWKRMNERTNDSGNGTPANDL